MNNFNNVIGYNNIKYELERIIDCINNKEKYEHLGVRIPKNLLLYGEPGLGKTLVAKCFVDALKRKKYIVRKNKPNGDFVNELNTILTDAINNTPSVVLLDDIDKFSNNDDKHKNSDEFVVLQSFIDDAKDKDIYFIATANELDDMPSSLIRAGRFDTKIEFESPSINDSALIIEHYLKNKMVDDSVNSLQIAKILDGRSCAILESIINEAGLYAGFNNKEKISMDDIYLAVLRILYNSPKNLDDISDVKLNIAAYHESGHALVAEILEPKSVNIVTIEHYTSPIGGLTSQTKNEDYWYDINYMENRIRVLLAGKAATDIIFKKKDPGCFNDIKRAESITTRLVTSYEYGFEFDEPSEIAKRHCEYEITKALDKYYNEAKEILLTNKDKLIEIAELLKSKKIITQIDLNKILR